MSRTHQRRRGHPHLDEPLVWPFTGEHAGHLAWVVILDELRRARRALDDCLAGAENAYVRWQIGAEHLSELWGEVTRWREARSCGCVPPPSVVRTLLERPNSA